MRLRRTFIVLSFVRVVSEAGGKEECAGGNVTGNDGNHIPGSGRKSRN